MFALLLMFALATWLFIRERQLNTELQRMRVDRAQIQKNHEELQSKLAAEQREKSELLQQLQKVREPEQPKEPQSTPVVATFVLPLISTRGGEGTSFTLKNGVDMVHFQAPIATVDYKSYEADLASADGASVSQLTSLKTRKSAKGNELLLSFPAKILKPKDYVLTIRGVAANGQREDVGFYSFRINKN